jgi:tetratricopeptide (TPR) repeat protein
MNATRELERWRAQAIDRLDRQNAGLSLLGSVVADTGMTVRLIQADIARLLAVTDQALSVIIDHLALVGDRLAAIEQLLAGPKETEAWELFRSGFRALTSAIEMLEKGSQGIADRRLDAASKDLKRAVETYDNRPEFWYLLGIARALHGSSEDAAEAFSKCADRAVSDSPSLAAESVLSAARQLRSIGQEPRARDLLHEFLPRLERCAEIHFDLAKHHGEPERLKRALELYPLLAAVAEDVPSVEEAAAEVCRHEDGPVSRLRNLEKAIHRLADAAKEIGLDHFSDPLTSVDLPDFGVEALLKAELSIQLLGGRRKGLVNDVTTGLEQLEASAKECWHQYQVALTCGRHQIKEARERAARAKRLARERSKVPLVKERQIKENAERAYRRLEPKLRQATSKLVEAQKVQDAYSRIYDENGEIRPEALKRFQAIWKGGRKTTKLRAGDEDYDRLLYWYYSRNKAARQHVPFYESYLHRIGKEGDAIQAELERARQNFEDVTTVAQTAQQAVRRRSESVEMIRQRLVDGDLRRELQESEQKADRACQRIVQPIEGRVQSAKLRYDSARNKSQQSKETMASFLKALDAAIQSSTASRNRIIPSI